MILGPRQTGKTTLLKEIVKDHEASLLWINGDDAFDRRSFDNASVARLKKITGNKKILVIDEAQLIPNIGLAIKLIFDHIPSVKVIASGSSSFDLTNKVNEPLTGRKWEFWLYPVSWKEYENSAGVFEARKNLEIRIIYGMYPEVLNSPGNEEDILKELSGSYLYKDLLSLTDIRRPDLLEKLLHALALQLGSEVSFNELSQMLQVDKKTISQYLQLLEKAFVIFPLKPFSRNLRNEITSSRKIYFFDTGIRNAILNDFSNFELRRDKGALWENFLVAERIKRNSYMKYNVNIYFWRNHHQQEIDLIEERNAVISAYELKWTERKKVKFPKTFIDTYQPAETMVISNDNFDEWLQ